MRFLLDENVPVSAAEVFTKAGHEVLLLTDATPKGSPDALVAIAAIENEAVLVTYDSDFRAIAERLGTSQRRVRKLHVVRLRCDPPTRALRLETAMSFIEHEWQAVAASDGRLSVQVLAQHLSTNR